MTANKLIISNVATSSGGKSFVGMNTTYNTHNEWGPPPYTSSTRRSYDEHWRRQFLACLYTSDYELFMRINPEPVHGTCEWFLGHEKFGSWLNVKNSSFLWVSGDPGCGKSVLASFLVNELRSQKYQSVLPGTVCHFFFKDSNVEQRSAQHALSALAHQILSAECSRVFLDTSVQRIMKNGRTFAREFGNLSNLWNILVGAATNRLGGNCICILDGLDECEDSGALIEDLVHFYSERKRQDKAFLKIIITSRPYSSIQSRFRKLSGIRLKLEDESNAIRNGIELVVKAKMAEIGGAYKLCETIQQRLVEQLVKNSDGSYLWLKMIFDEIQDKEGKGDFHGAESDFKEILDNGNMDAVFERILKRIPEKQAIIAKKIFTIVVTAVRPLTVEEINIASAIDRKHSSYGDLKNIFPDPETSIKNICGLLVRIIESKVYLVHHMAKEYLLKSTAKIAPTQWKPSSDWVESNRALTEICISYLFFTEFNKQPLIMHPEILEKAVGPHANRHAFFDYAARNWARHFQVAMGEDDQALSVSAKNLCNTKSSRFSTWFQVYWKMAVDPQLPYPKDITELMVRSILGHQKAVQLLLKEGYDVNAEAEFGMTALHGASRNGHQAVVNCLLENGADVIAKDGAGRGPLLLGAANGHGLVVDLLLQSGAAVDLKFISRDGWTPLLIATWGGYTDVVRLIIGQKDIEINSRDGEGFTPISRAVWSGNLDMTKLLIECQNINLELQDSNNMTPLSRATYNQQIAILELILTKDVNVNSEDDEGCTPLSRAVYNWQEGMVLLLLKNKGIEMNSRDMDDMTPLSRAVYNWQEGTVRLLLEKEGIEMNSLDVDGMTPLSRAVYNKQEGTVRLLLEKEGIEMNCRDVGGMTPLRRAHLNFQWSLVRLLKEYGRS